jgi:outer membrane protein assembly factor BamB
MTLLRVCGLAAFAAACAAACALQAACTVSSRADRTATPPPVTPAARLSPAASAAAAASAANSPAAAASRRGTDVVTFKNDLNRSGQNSTETTLTPANVTPATFGLLRVLSVDGKVDAQPLYLSRFLVAGAAHNVVLAATEHDSVYAFDADSGAVLWKVSLLGAGEIPSDTHGCNQVSPEIGITSTPVIDRGAGAHGTVFVVAMSKDSASAYHQRLHALDLSTGAELPRGAVEISATFPSANGGATAFSAGQYEERAALLLARGTIYTTWTSHCDIPPYSGWIIAYAEDSLARTAVLNVAPNGDAGPAIWMSGSGPAADAAGNIYLLTANGAFETTLDAHGFPRHGDFGNSFLKLTRANGGLAVADYFTMFNEVAESAADRDLGSGGALLLPDLKDAAGTVRHLVIGAGKDGNIYLVDRDSMGKFNAAGNSIWQELDGVLPGGIRSSPAWFNGTVYYGDAGSTLKAFALTDAKLSSAPRSQSPSHFGFPGTSPSVSADGRANGIVWAHESSNPAVLHAYDAGNLSIELYNSKQAANHRDHFGAGNKFITPTIADGKVFVGTTTGVAVFGLLQ